MIAVDHYTNLNLKYNPFSYLNEEELLQVTEDRIDLESIAQKIQSSDSCLVQFYGKKGRGKSTHLQALHQMYFPDSVFYKLKRKYKPYIAKSDKILIIDSFQLLSLKNRIELLKSQQKIVIAAHTSHEILNFKRRAYNEKISFSKVPLDLAFISNMIDSRIELAKLNTEKPRPKLRTSYVEKLYHQYQDNLRGIQEALYEFFLNPEKENYEL